MPDRIKEEWSIKDVKMEPRDETDNTPSSLDANTNGGEDHQLNELENKCAEKMNQIRRWCYTNLGGDLVSGTRVIFGDNVKFRLVNYNILSQSSLRRNLFKKKDSRILSWSYRLAALLRELDRLAPDVICMQEVEFTSVSTVMPDLASALADRGFSYRGRQRPGRPDGCAIFYRASMFDCEASVDVNLQRDNVPHLSGSQVGVICRLKPKNVVQRLVVGTVHLQFGVDKQVSRLAQLAVFLAGEFQNEMEFGLLKIVLFFYFFKLMIPKSVWILPGAKSWYIHSSVYLNASACLT